MQDWKPIEDWLDLPVGEWIVKRKRRGTRRDYMIADVWLNSQGEKIITAGGMFHFDAGEIEAYSPFERYKA